MIGSRGLTLRFSHPPAGAPVAHASGVTGEWGGCNGMTLSRGDLPGWHHAAHECPSNTLEKEVTDGILLWH